MDETISLSDYVFSLVKPKDFFQYPENKEITQEIEIVRRSAKKANEAKECYAQYLETKELLDTKVPPVFISVLLGGLAETLGWLAKFIVLFVIIGAFCLLMVLFGAEGFDGKSVMIGLGGILLFLYIGGILKTLFNVQDLIDARRIVTTGRHEYEALKEKEHNQFHKLMVELIKLEEIGGIPASLSLVGDQIWNYFLEGRADNLKEALVLYEKDKRTEDFMGSIADRSISDMYASMYNETLHSLFRSELSLCLKMRASSEALSF